MVVDVTGFGAADLEFGLSQSELDFFLALKSSLNYFRAYFSRKRCSRNSRDGGKI